MRRFRNILIIVTITMLSVFILNLKISADQLTFSVEPTLPKNQIDGRAGFFNILLAPGETQNLELKYKNNTKKEVTVNSVVSSAKTNVNGVVDYNSSNIKNDPTLKYDMSDLIKLQNSVTLNPGETKKIVVQVTMPQDKFDGIIAGGFTFSDGDQNQKNKSESEDGVSIKNIYSFQIGILMRQSAETPFSDNYIQAMGLQLKKVKAGQLNYRNVIYANLQNPLSVYLNQMVVRAEILKDHSSKILYTITKGDMQMAPNSNFNFPISLGSGALMNPGKYNLKLTVYSLKDSSGQYSTKYIDNKMQSFRYKWEFNKDFTITEAQASRYNKADVTNKQNNWLLWILLSFLALMVTFSIWYLLFLKRRHNEKTINIEEEVLDFNNKLVKVTRKVTIKQYKKMLKNGEKVKLIDQ